MFFYDTHISRTRYPVQPAYKFSLSLSYFRRHTYFAKLDILRIIGRLALFWHSPVVARVLVGNDYYSIELNRDFPTNALHHLASDGIATPQQAFTMPRQINHITVKMRQSELKGYHMGKKKTQTWSSGSL